MYNIVVQRMYTVLDCAGLSESSAKYAGPPRESESLGSKKINFLFPYAVRRLRHDLGISESEL